MKPVLLGSLGATLFAAACSDPVATHSATAQTPEPAATPSVFDTRRADWRTGAVTYQIFVDRFAPSADLDAKRHLYGPPRELHDWSVQPERGHPVTEVIVWSHELAFWGGDLNSIRERVDYLDALGIDVVYLNPIVNAPTNHKYDAVDLDQIAPEYGTKDDLRALADALHGEDMRLVLDGVFNHVGSTSTWFTDAMASEDSAYRDWFHIGEQYQNGYVGWWGVENLPELNWDNPAVRDRIVHDADSIVRHWFDYGIDGWRLDVATELGYEHLASITAAAHEERPGSLVIGEVWSYPENWSTSLDAVMNFPMRAMMFAMVEDRIEAGQFGEAVELMIADAGLDPVLMSWIVLDNHDTPRLATLYPDPADRAFLQSLQFTLPGAPLVYYGVEAGMEGGEDPGSRGPMDWDNAVAGNPEFDRLRDLIALREASPALRIGDFRRLAADELLAFLRTTDRSAETVLVVANSGDEPVTETLLMRDSSIMSGESFEDVLTGETFASNSAVITVEVPANTVRILRPQRWAEHTERTGHSPYHNVP